MQICSKGRFLMMQAHERLSTRELDEAARFIVHRMQHPFSKRLGGWKAEQLIL